MDETGCDPVVLGSKGRSHPTVLTAELEGLLISLQGLLGFCVCLNEFPSL